MTLEPSNIVDETGMAYALRLERGTGTPAIRAVSLRRTTVEGNSTARVTLIEFDATSVQWHGREHTVEVFVYYETASRRFPSRLALTGTDEHREFAEPVWVETTSSVPVEIQSVTISVASWPTAM